MEDTSLYCDGASRGNPGPAAYGVAIFRNGESLHQLSQAIGRATNNEAEYQALLAAAKWARDNQIQRAFFYMDSELVVKQISGIYKVKNERLKSYHLSCKTILNSLPFWKITHVPREKNKEADKLANEALDSLAET